MVIIEDVSREDAIERILTYLSLSEHSGDGPEGEVVDWDYLTTDQKTEFSKFQRIPLRYFDGAQPFAYLSLMFLTQSYDRTVWEPSDPELQKLPMPTWDATILGVDENGPEKGKELGHPYLYSMQRIRKVQMKEVRGLFQPKTGTLIERATADIFGDGKFKTERVYCELRGGKWYVVGAPYATVPLELTEQETTSVWMHKSIALTSEYDWQVHISYNLSELPSIALTTDPVGSKDIFKLRDVPKGKSRRDALRNWVSGHWRKSGVPDKPEIHIWPFLRGSEEFTWNGLYCKIQPSVYDLKKAKEYQERAAKQKK